MLTGQQDKARALLDNLEASWKEELYFPFGDGALCYAVIGDFETANYLLSLSLQHREPRLLFLIPFFQMITKFAETSEFRRLLERMNIPPSKVSD